MQAGACTSNRTSWPRKSFLSSLAAMLAASKHQAGSPKVSTLDLSPASSEANQAATRFFSSRLCLFSPMPVPLPLLLLPVPSWAVILLSSFRPWFAAWPLTADWSLFAAWSMFAAWSLFATWSMFAAWPLLASWSSLAVCSLLVAWSLLTAWLSLLAAWIS